jgi:hypothetical protein
MQNVQEPFPFVVSVQGMRYREPSVNGALAQTFGSGPKQVILRHVLYVGRKSCNKRKIAEVEVAYHLKYHVAQASSLPHNKQ